VLLTDERDVTRWTSQVSTEPLIFRTTGVGQPFDFSLKPFFSTYDQYYSVYFDFFTPAAWQERKAEYEAEKQSRREIELKTIDNFRIGEMQPERDHHLEASERSYVDEALGRMGREARAGTYMLFTMTVRPGEKNSLLLTCLGDDTNRKFDVLVNGTRIATIEWNGGKTGQFYDLIYAIPGDLTRGVSDITVRIEANYNLTAGRIFGVRTLAE
jgi:hypothetical protein